VALRAEAPELVKKLFQTVTTHRGPPIRRLVGDSIGLFLNAAGTGELSTIITKSMELVKPKDDPATIHAKLAGMEIIGAAATVVQRALFPFIADIIKELLKAFKSSDPSVRTTAMRTFERIAAGLGDASGASKDMFKCIKASLGDKALEVRTAGVECALALAKESNWLQTTELENSLTAALKGLEDSSYLHRTRTAQFIGTILASCYDDDIWRKAKKRPTNAEVVGMLHTGFIKGGGDKATREIRVGVAQAYVVYYNLLGATWAERNIDTILKELLQLLVHPTILKASMQEGLCARTCILHVIVTILGRSQAEEGRTQAVMSLSKHLSGYLEIAQGKGKDAGDGGHVLTCVLDAMAALIEIIGTPIALIYKELMTPSLSAGLHPQAGVRLAAANCLRSLGNAVPSQGTYLANACMERLTKFRSSPDAVHGYSYSLAAVIGGSASSPLGLPYELAANVLKLGETLARTTSTNKADFAGTIAAINAGWILIGSLTSLGSAAVDPHLSRISGLWATMFPETQEKIKDTNMWRQIIEGRAGALGSVSGFLTDCKELATMDTVKLIAKCLTTAVKLMADIPATKSKPELAASTTRMRTQLYNILCQLPVNLYEEIFSSILPFLVADFTLVDASTRENVTSLLRSMCHQGDGILLGDSTQEKDEKAIESQLESPHGAGCLENCPSVISMPSSRYTNQPLPIPIELIDSAVLLFGKIYPCLPSQKHRHQLLEHFTTCIKGAKVGVRRHAMQINIFTAVLAALKGTVDQKASLGNEKVVATARDLVLDALAADDETLRCAAGEALGRMGQVAGGQFVSTMVQLSVDRIQKDGNIGPRTGFSLALGCIHRYVGGMGGTAHHLETSVGVLDALAKLTTPVVRVWALHALMLMVDAAGNSFSRYISSTLALVEDVMLSAPDDSVQVQCCAGTLLNTLIGVLGPELQADTEKRTLMLGLCKELQGHPNGQVQLAGLLGFQQMIVFAAKFVDMPAFIPQLQATLSSPNLQLRAAAINCLRQLAQREPSLVLQHGKQLEETLFRLLDVEDEPRVQSNLQETLRTLLTASAATTPLHWLLISNNVLSGANEMAAAGPTAADGGDDDGDGDDGDGDDDENQVDVKVVKRVVLPTRWQTKVFAVTCVCQVIRVCARAQEGAHEDSPHFNLELAKQQGGGEFLVTKLSELVRTTFLAATSAVNELRKAGLEALEEIIFHFANSIDVEVGGNHSLLEQYQAQVTSAMRPAFDTSTPPDVTAIAAKVIASWICSGVNRNVGDLKRVINLLVKRLDEIKAPADPAYNERATTMLRIAMLTSWARIGTTGKTKAGCEYLTEIVSPHAEALAVHWQDALRDYALMSLPPEYRNQVPESGEFYYPGTTVAALVYFEEAFPSLVQAAAMYTDVSDAAAHGSNNFYLLLGLCTRTLCGRASEEQALACLNCLKHLVGQSKRLSGDAQLFAELCKVLNHAAYTSGMAVKQGVIEVLNACVTGEYAIADTMMVGAGGGTAVTEALKLVTGVVLRECPFLADSASTTGSPTTPTPPTKSADGVHLAAAGIQTLCALPALCTADVNGKVAVGQTAMVVLSNAFKSGDVALAAEAAKGCKVLVGAGGSNYSKDGQWAGLIVSGLQTIVEQLEQPVGPSTEHLLLTLAIFLVTGGEEVQHETLQGRISSVLQKLIAEPAIKTVQLKAAQVLLTLAQLPCGRNVRFIRDVAPYVIAMLSEAATKKPESVEEVLVLAEAVKLLSVLAAQATAGGLPKVIAMVVTLCVALLETDPTSCGQVRYSLHQLALNTLNQIGPMYPGPFREVIVGAPALAQRMTVAVRASAAQATAAAGPDLAAAAAQRRATELAAAAPKIELKMDFGSFT
jgi:hypothetical protein